jgi:chemotaxis protein histidine kinase CheA
MSQKTHIPNSAARLRTQKIFLKQVTEKLTEMRIILREKRWNKYSHNALTSHCFAMKGQADMMGFLLLAQAADSLMQYVEIHQPEGKKDEKIIVAKHLEVIDLATKFHTIKDGGEKGKKIIASLQKLIGKLTAEAQGEL